MVSTNELAECITESFGGGFLDSNNIKWKHTKNGWIGKRSVFTDGYRSVWLEDLNGESVKYWWCGKDSDYNEVFKR